ncbi:MAG: hypothetical protein WC080_02795 [Patescibacteria group bacterium]|jgi:hypothetical protein
MNEQGSTTPSEYAEVNHDKIGAFRHEHDWQPVSFIETMQVIDGVECDVYTFDDDPDKDLGVIRVQPGMKTPLQRVLKGESTIEGYLAGKGKLTVTKPDGSQKIYDVEKEDEEPEYFSIGIDDTMQWEAAPDSALTAYEICLPPYEDGRFENIEE